MLLFGFLCSLCVVLSAEVVDEQLLSVLRDVDLEFDSPARRLLDVFNFTSVEEQVQRRVVRDIDLQQCSCGPGTVNCMTYNRGKLCKCENQLYVIDGECADCGDYCSNALCDFRTGVCTCIKHHARNVDECVPCDCGEDISCDFAIGIKFCVCNNYLSVNSKCDECVCRDNEFCIVKPVETYCDCASTGENADPNCEHCDCFDEDQNCSYVQNVQACHCIPPGVLNEEGNCVDCSCEGDDYECSFEDGQKKCSCKSGYVEYNGTCKECDCGDGHSCNIDDGNKICICKEDHVEYNGTCRQCDCDANEVCEIEQDQVRCVCKEHYSRNYHGICQECFCGHGHSCVLFPFGRKVCLCKDKYLINNGTCEECDCGTAPKHWCKFKDGKKSCQCAENFADNNGKCEECTCGGDFPCFFENGVKTCICNESFILHEGKCHEVCHSSSCLYGICEGIGMKSYCRCDLGFTGTNCDEQIVSTGIIVFISSAAVIITLCSAFLIIYCRSLKSNVGYSENLTEQSEELYVDIEVYKKEETVL